MPVRTLALAAAVVAGFAALTPGVDPPAPAKPADKPADKAAPKPADLATRLRVRQQVKQLLIAMHAYHDAHDAFPHDLCNDAGTPLLSWRVAILPFVEQQGLYQQFKLNEPWDSEHNKALLGQMPDLFKVGGEPKGEAKTAFQGLAGAGALFEPGKALRMSDVSDGLSNTLAVLVAGPAVEWTKPADLEFDWTDPKVPPSRFANVLVAGTCDGAVYQLPPDLDAGLFGRLAAVADGNVIPDLSTLSVPLKPETKEDEAFAADLVKKNEAAAKEAGALLAERQKLLAEAAKKRAAADPKDLDLEALSTDQERLAKLVKELKAEVRRLKGEPAAEPEKKE